MIKSRAQQLANDHWDYVKKVISYATKRCGTISTEMCYKSGFLHGYTGLSEFDRRKDIQTGEEYFHYNSAFEHGAKHRSQDCCNIKKAEEMEEI